MEILKISLIGYMFVALGQDEGMIFYRYQQMIKKLPDWISFPLGGCYKCFVGQLCFWYYILTKPFHLIDFLFFVSAGIFISVVYHFIYTFIE